METEKYPELRRRKYLAVGMNAVLLFLLGAMVVHQCEKFQVTTVWPCTPLCQAKSLPSGVQVDLESAGWRGPGAGPRQGWALEVVRASVSSTYLLAPEIIPDCALPLVHRVLAWAIIVSKFKHWFKLWLSHIQTSFLLVGPCTRRDAVSVPGHFPFPLKVHCSFFSSRYRREYQTAVLYLYLWHILELYYKGYWLQSCLKVNLALWPVRIIYMPA